MGGYLRLSFDTGKKDAHPAGPQLSTAQLLKDFHDALACELDRLAGETSDTEEKPKARIIITQEALALVEDMLENAQGTQRSYSAAGNLAHVVALQARARAAVSSSRGDAQKMVIGSADVVTGANESLYFRKSLRYRPMKIVPVP